MIPPLPPEPDLATILRRALGLPAGKAKLRQAPWKPGMEHEGKMVAYFGFRRMGEQIVQVDNLGAGAGKITCAECRGTGRFDFPTGVGVCVRCKGAGWVLISVW